MIFLRSQKGTVRALHESGKIPYREASEILHDDTVFSELEQESEFTLELEKAALARYEKALEEASKQYEVDVQKRRRIGM